MVQKTTTNYKIRTSRHKMLLLDANVSFKKHWFAALDAVFIVMPYQTTQFLVDSFVVWLSVFFSWRICYLLIGGSLDFWLCSQHTNEPMFAYVMVSRIPKLPSEHWHYLTAPISAQNWMYALDAIERTYYMHGVCAFVCNLMRNVIFDRLFRR